jgi:hypothetical protein
MLKPYRSWPSQDSTKADLAEMDADLTRMRPLVLLGRFHPEVLRRWAYLRCCVASALEGEHMARIETMHDGVADLAAVVSRRFGPEPWP